MPETTYSFVYDRSSADREFRCIVPRALILAILAGIPPQSSWDGCLVYSGTSPIEGSDTVCIGTTGPAADTVQERIIEALERQGIRILQVYEGGPEVAEALARASAGKWVSG